MNLRTIISRIIPMSLKQYIKTQLVGADVSATVEYIIKTSDIGKLEEKAVIITGGTGAIGSAIVHRLYLEGATIGICGRDMNKVNSVIERLKKKKLLVLELVPIYLDVTNDSSIETGIDEFVSHVGHLDVFINNAGGGARAESKAIHEQSVEIIDRVLNTNLRGSIMCARKAAQVMVEQNNGVIINMSSVVGMRGKERMS